MTIFPSTVTSAEIQAAVMALDMNNLTDEQIQWLHDLKNQVTRKILLEQARKEGYSK
jgi:hypothetical protein